MSKKKHIRKPKWICKSVHLLQINSAIGGTHGMIYSLKYVCFQQGKLIQFQLIALRKQIKLIAQKVRYQFLKNYLQNNHSCGIDLQNGGLRLKRDTFNFLISCLQYSQIQNTNLFTG